ncbi:hypothetical protein BJY01DRAFT_253571 [Aspergillus pseudoustus]|uniref:Glycine zipper 2TM domain-containing protein n=1 Tax=Aspergillus pseudoustus TaxID=1810923 RepID=A0ABR4IZD3_9EURO
MSNRDYYGDNVPVGLEQNPSTDPHFNYTPQPGQEFQTQQPQQTPWTDASRSDGYDPNLNPNGPAEESEKGLGATVVGGAGGAFVGHKVGKKSDHGTLGAIGGALAGAVAANLASNMIKGNNGHGNGHGHAGVHGHGGGGLGIAGSMRERRRERLERRLDRLG